MKLVLQRVSRASVDVDGEITGSIGAGLLVLCCIEKGDDTGVLEAMARKVVQCRIFEDENGRMNKSLAETGGALLLVSQFTLAADLRKGTRPSFDGAEKPDAAREKIAEFRKHFEKLGIHVEEGRFGAMMQVSLINDGPVTFVMQSSS